MKLIILKNYIKEGVSLAERVTGKNLTLPILNNVLLIAEDNNLKLKATNLEIGVEVVLPAKVLKKGKISVSAQTLHNFISNLYSDDQVTIESDGYNLSIVTKNTSTVIKGQPTEDFPTFPVIQNKNEFSISSQDLFFGLKSVWYAASISHIKPEISSVFMTQKNKEIKFVATDSFRLAEKKIPFSLGVAPDTLIPYKSVIEIIRILDGKTGKAIIVADKDQLSLKIDSVTFISRLVDGIFPDYEQIIPKNITTDVIIDKQVFVNSLKSAGIFLNKLNELSILSGEDNKTIIIKTSNTELGEHVAKIQVQKTGEDFNMVFNYKYVFDCLQYIPSEKVLLRFSGAGKPLIITGSDNSTFLYLVMSIHSSS